MLLLFHGSASNVVENGFGGDGGQGSNIYAMDSSLLLVEKKKKGCPIIIIKQKHNSFEKKKKKNERGR